MANNTSSSNGLPVNPLVSVLSSGRQDCIGNLTEVPTQCCFCCDSLDEFVTGEGLIVEWCQLGCLEHLNFTCSQFYDPLVPNNEDNQRYCSYGAAFASEQRPLVDEARLICGADGILRTAGEEYEGNNEGEYEGDGDGGDKEGEGGLGGREEGVMEVVFIGIAGLVLSLILVLFAFHGRRKFMSFSNDQKEEDEDEDRERDRDRVSNDVAVEAHGSADFAESKDDDDASVKSNLTVKTQSEEHEEEEKNNLTTGTQKQSQTLTLKIKRSFQRIPLFFGKNDSTQNLSSPTNKAILGLEQGYEAKEEQEATPVPIHSESTSSSSTKNDF